MQKITPFLWFDGQAEEAAKFYTSIFKGKITDVSRATEGSHLEAGTVMVVNFELFGQEFIALNGGPEFKFTEALSFMVRCETQAEVDEYWERLLEGGGQEVQCGWLKDRYGLSWQITPTVLLELLSSPDRERAQRVMQAMMKMVKLDIAKLVAA